MKKLNLLLLVLVAACFLVACSNKDTTSSRPKIETPTFFFHGWGSSINAEKQMVRSASRSINASILTAIVDKHGKVNLVGHSMGNMSIMFMIKNYHNRKNFPQVNKQVDIAGHFNGICGISKVSESPLSKSGKPSKLDETYRQLLPIKEIYPKSLVMNIFGNKDDDSNSDGPVAVNSARSLRYLVMPNAKGYIEHEIHGRKEQHSQLHENIQVDKLLIDFLW